MCGILGAASTNQIYNRDWLCSGRTELLHRGPDASGEWTSSDGRVIFHHQRLAVIDLQKKSNQPMAISNENYCIIFNGELYNFQEIKLELINYGKRFRTNSDTEVLLQAYMHWGNDCVSHFNGMFSFAIYDNYKKTVFLSRDRAGEKPLFYHHDRSNFYFASELKALLKNPELKRNFNLKSLDCYLTLGYVPNDLCILEGFNKLPPAHSMIFHIESGKLEVFEYWKIPEFVDSNPTLEHVLLDELDLLFQDAVNKQLTSDVPVGVLLSGGIDSSLITAYAARSVKNLKTFTVRIPGNKLLDETEHARLIAKHFQTDHIELDAVEANVDLLPTLAKHFDEPMADSSMIPTFLVSKLVREHCTVALGGDGGDELFGGYGHYSRLLWMQKNLRLIPFLMRKAVGSLSTNILPVGFKGRNWLGALNIDLASGLPLIASQFDRKTRMRLVPSLKNLTTSAEDIFFNNMPQNDDLLQRATRMDFKNYLAEDILVKVDRASMANSLEMRAPMLDYRMIEFAFSKVSGSLKANQSEKKILLKKLTERILPKEFDRNRKQGFSIPLNKWLISGPSRDFFNDVLTDSSCMFDRATTKELLVGIDRGRANSERLFALVMMELWRKEYGVSL